jgi:pseudouridine synthase
LIKDLRSNKSRASLGLIKSMGQIYLQQFLSQAGIASRREAINLIKSGRVKVNNKQAVIGQKVDPLKDKIEFAGRHLKPEPKVYYLVNKPVGYTCTLKDKFATKKITDLVPRSPKVWPIGRLDKGSRGLIILTNDGDLTNSLTHPKFSHEKEYLITLDKKITPALLAQLKKGIKLVEGITRVDKVEIIADKKLSIVIHQGWKRQIRRMFSACGYQVMDLMRVRIGRIKLGELKEGEYKQIKIKPVPSDLT